MYYGLFLKNRERHRNNSIGFRHSIFACFGSGAIQSSDLLPGDGRLCNRGAIGAYSAGKQHKNKSDLLWGPCTLILLHVPNLIVCHVLHPFSCLPSVTVLVQAESPFFGLLEERPQ